MKCTPIPGGFACGARRDEKPCTSCGGVAQLLCDFPLSGKKAGKTCDRAVCVKCAKRVSPGVDYCRAHADAKLVPAETPNPRDGGKMTNPGRAARLRDDDDFADLGKDPQ